MDCYCCRRDVSLVHRVQLRGIVMDDEPPRSPLQPDYNSFVNEMAFRTAFICRECYESIDTVDGIGEVGGKMFQMADEWRNNQAPLYNWTKFDEYHQH
jgi:hypothetical protein